MSVKENNNPVIAQDDELDYSLNIGNINGGQLPEVFAKLQALVMENIRDVNTSATKKRSLTLKVVFAPSADRKSCQVQIEPSLKLAPQDLQPGTVHIAKIKGKVVGFVHDPTQDELRFTQTEGAKQ